LGFSLVVPALLIGLLAAPGGSAGGTTPSSGTTAGVTYYAIGVPACPVAKAGYYECTAVRKVEVAAGTPGALPYKPGAGVAAGAKIGPSSTIGPAGGLTPSDFATAYDFNPTATGSNQTVAIVDAYNDPNINADLQTFDTNYGLPTCSTGDGCFKVVNQTGGSTPPADDTTGWSVEESLDVDTVHSVCQECKIILVEANSNSNSNLGTAVNEAATLGATEITNSYGGPEGGGGTSDYNHPGIVITVSSGDDGYYDFDELGATNVPNSPASLNTVVAVGGTSLYLGQTAARQNETVWNDDGARDYDEQLTGDALGASGGGCSTLYTAQGWQKSVSDWASTACGSNRLVTDISADADYLTGFDLYDSYNCDGGCTAPDWATYGGTSLASPLIAAMYALAGGAQGVSYPSLTLYGHLGTSSLYDVTSGGNGWCDGEGAAECGDPNTLGYGIVDCDYPGTGSTPSAGDLACDAGTGFDGPSGVGTPNGLGAFTATGPTATIAGPTTIKHAKSGKWTATTTDPFPGGSVTSYKWNWGDGSSTTTTTTGSSKHTYAKAGSYTITLTVTDNYGQTGTATYKVTAS
jgi:hypothetical protein